MGINIHQLEQAKDDIERSNRILMADKEDQEERLEEALESYVMMRTELEDLELEKNQIIDELREELSQLSENSNEPDTSELSNQMNTINDLKEKIRKQEEQIASNEEIFRNKDNQRAEQISQLQQNLKMQEEHLNQVSNEESQNIELKEQVENLSRQVLDKEQLLEDKNKLITNLTDKISGLTSNKNFPSSDPGVSKQKTPGQMMLFKQDAQITKRLEKNNIDIQNLKRDKAELVKKIENLQRQIKNKDDEQKKHYIQTQEKLEREIKHRQTLKEKNEKEIIRMRDDHKKQLELLESNRLASSKRMQDKITALQLKQKSIPNNTPSSPNSIASKPPMLQENNNISKLSVRADNNAVGMNQRAVTGRSHIRSRSQNNFNKSVDLRRTRSLNNPGHSSVQIDPSTIAKDGV